MTDMPAMTMRRLLMESAVIVGSILLAFAIDAWWQERSERKDEIVLLERLRSDFGEIRDALEVVAYEHEEALAASRSLLQIDVGEAIPTTSAADRMLAAVFLAVRTFNPSYGAVASFLNGEGAQLVRNKALSDKLMAWPGLVDELQEEELSMQKASSERWTPYLMSRVNLGPYYASFGEIIAGIPARVAAPEQRVPLVADQEFLNQVLERYKWQKVTLRDLEPVRDAVEEILALLDTELDR